MPARKPAAKPRRQRIRTVYINAQRWKIVRCKLPPDRVGECDYNTRTIRIGAQLHGEDYLNTLIHEIIHARWYDLDETAVLDIADLLAGVIYAENFRCPDDHDE